MKEYIHVSVWVSCESIQEEEKESVGRRLEPLSPSASHPPLHPVPLLLEGKTRIFPLFNVFLSAGPIPLRIREARVPIVNDNECVRKINTVTEKIFILPASSFCAGGVKGHDACQVRS